MEMKFADLNVFVIIKQTHRSLKRIVDKKVLLHSATKISKENYLISINY